MAPRDIPGGAEYGDVINEAIKNTKVFVLVYSDNSSRSQWVKAETNLALANGKVIIPFRIDDSSLSGSMQLYLNDKHWIDAFPEPEQHFGKVVDSVQNSLGKNEEKSERRNAGDDEVLQKQRARKIYRIAKCFFWVGVFGAFGLYWRGKYFASKEVQQHSDSDIKVEERNGASSEREGSNTTNTPYARAMRSLEAKDWERFSYWAELTDYQQWDVCIKAGLGHCYREGVGGKSQDGKRAFDLLSEAVQYVDVVKNSAESNAVTRAQLELGICYHTGMGVASNHAEAVKWYRKSADRGYAAAQFCLGACYHHGVGVAQDENEALTWYRKAVAGGYTEAQQSIDKILKGRESSLSRRERNLSIREMHLKGMALVSGIDGGKHDKKEEYELFRDIASHENDKDLDEEERECVGNALFVLGTYCREGVPELVKKDLEKAFDYYYRAAKFGNPVAQFNLGMCYERGDGVARDYRKSIEWYGKALEAGFEKAKGGIERIKRTPGVTTEYVVRRGDHYGAIAYRHGTSIRVLRILNGLQTNDSIRVGQKLVVPVANR